MWHKKQQHGFCQWSASCSISQVDHLKNVSTKKYIKYPSPHKYMLQNMLQNIVTSI